jgi:hypothetical protein
MKNVKNKSAPTTNSTTDGQPPLALDVKRVRKQIRTGAQGGSGPSGGGCMFISWFGWV